MTPVEVAYLGMSVVLALSGLVIVYPALAGAQVVVYRRAVLTLGTSILVFVASWWVIFLALVDWLPLDVVAVLSLAGDAVAGVLHLLAVWWFARDFVDLEDRTVDISVGDSSTGGFADEQE